MAKDPVREYLDAKSELDKAKNTIREMTLVINKVATALRLDRERFVVTGTEIVIPAELLGGNVDSLKANEWPSAEQIAQNLKVMHDAHRKAKVLWEVLSDSDKKNSVPPDYSML